jgi:hypothetical protein
MQPVVTRFVSKEWLSSISYQPEHRQAGDAAR